MASSFFNVGLRTLVSNQINWATADIRMALVINGGFAFDKTKLSLDAALAGAETVATNYVRKATTGRSVVAGSTPERPAVFRLDPLIWPSMGYGGVNETLGGAILYWFNGTDAQSVPLIFVDTDPLSTTGTDILFTPDPIDGIAGITTPA